MRAAKEIYKIYSTKVRNFRYRRLINYLKFKDFSILSSDCIGGILYHDLKKPFSSPTINLFFREDNYSFLNFCLDTSYYCNKELVFLNSNSYPKAVIRGDLGHQDIYINFMHYLTIDDAKESWQRRCARLSKKQIFIYLKFKLDENDISLINSIDNIFVITSNRTNKLFLDNKNIHVSKYLSKQGQNNGKIMSFYGLAGSRNYDDMKIMEYLYNNNL